MKKILSFIISVLTIFTIAGCGKQAVNVSVSNIITDIKGVIAADMKKDGVDEERFKDGKLPGYIKVDLTSEDNKFSVPIKINKDDIEEGYILASLINIRSDEIIVLKAKDESKVADLKEKLEEEKQKQIKIWEQYLPDQYEKVKNNIIKTKGKYLIYITANNPEKIEEVFDKAFERK